MDRKWTLAGGVGLGAALMYFFDLEKGRRRRAIVRDKAVHVLHKTADGLRYVARGAAQRAEALSARTRSRLRAELVPDAVLAERVRSKLGHVLSHPGSIEVSVRGGRATLSGPILAREVDELLATISRVRGVTGIVNRLEVHGEADRVPGLQGGIPTAGAEGSPLLH